jgi:thiamine-phosphate diphosphorylase
LIVVTDGVATGERRLVAVVAAALEGGARAVLLREKHLGRPARAALADELRVMLAAVGGLLLVASDPSIPADGVHLAAGDAAPAATTALVGRSCHNRADVERAGAEGCDYATLSPIFASSSKPGYGPPLGPGALASLPVATWALGGVDATNAGACLAGGAAGVAVMGAIMRAVDPAAATAAIVDALAAVAA